jgi:hypothetical protein
MLDLVWQCALLVKITTDISPAFYERNPVDLAIEWAAGESPIPVIMPAHDKRPGGDWEAGIILHSSLRF